MMPGETVASIVGYPPPPTYTCPDCDKDMRLEVLYTCAPFLGYSCSTCGPYSRETEYYASIEEIISDQETMTVRWRY